MAAALRSTGVAPGGAVLVEFVGLPGAGKSALSRRLAQRLEGRGLAVDEPSRALAHGIGRIARRARKAARVWLEALGRPGAAARAARIVAVSGQPSTRAAALLWFNWLLVTALARRARRGSGVHLLDEGPAQGAWSVALEGDAACASALLERLPAAALPDLLVLVEAGPSVAADRIRARPERDSRLDRRLDAEPELLERGVAALAWVRAALEGRLGTAAGSRVVVLRNDRPKDLDRGASALTDRIVAIARRP
jgi:thymidylate kinase